MVPTGLRTRARSSGGLLVLPFRTRLSVQAETVALRHQLPPQLLHGVRGPSTEPTVTPSERQLRRILALPAQEARVAVFGELKRAIEQARGEPGRSGTKVTDTNGPHHHYELRDAWRNGQLPHAG